MVLHTQKGSGCPGRPVVASVTRPGAGKSQGLEDAITARLTPAASSSQCQTYRALSLNALVLAFIAEGLGRRHGAGGVAGVNPF